MLNGGGIGMKSEGGGGGNVNRLFAGVVVLVDVASEMNGKQIYNACKIENCTYKGEEAYCTFAH